MNKIYLSLSLGLLFGFAANAETLTPEQALGRLNNDSRVARIRQVSGNSGPRLVETTKTKAGDAAVYVFANDNKKEGGYLIVSADDVALPLLGFADNGSFDKDKMSPSMRWWLDEYARQIAWAKEHGSLAATSMKAPAGRHDVAPQIKTSWDQGEPYNAYCPIVNGMRAYTGCVATSMSQILNYFRYPEVGKGSISYNDDESGKRLSWNFSEHPFDWDNMLPTYRDNKWTAEQADAVAILMKSTGASVKMAYGQDSSGALGVYAPNALIKYFDYDPNIKYMLRSYVSTTEWDNMMYENIANIGPVLYGGGSFLGGGHSFIIDGYQAETGFYHVNWGWSEMSDGYFSLSALNPSALGAGGGNGGGYNFDQDGVFGIQKPTGDPVVKEKIYLTQYGTLAGELNDDNLVFSIVDDQDGAWINYSPQQLDVVMGVSVRKIGSNDSTVVVFNNIPKQRLPSGYGIYPANSNNKACSVDLSTLGLEDGTYKCTIVSQQTNILDQKNEWIPVRAFYGNNNYITVTKAGPKYTVIAERGKFYSVDEVDIVSGLYYGCLAKIRYKLTNNNDIEITRGIAPVIYQDNSPAFLGESKVVNIAPHETIEGEMVTELYSVSSNPFGISADTEVYVSLYEEMSGRILTDECFYPEVFHPNPGLPSISVKNYKIEGYDSKTQLIPDPANMHITATITLTKGIVAYPLCATILGEFDVSGNAKIIDFVGDPVFLSKRGDSYTLDKIYNFKTAVPGATYNLVLCYSIGSSLSPVLDISTIIGRRMIMITFKVPEAAGVEDITADDNSPVEWYNLQGLKVDYDNAPAGVYIRRQGSKTTKVLKH